MTELFISNIFILTFAAMLLITDFLLVQLGSEGLPVVQGDGIWFLIAGGIIGTNSNQQQSSDRSPDGE